MAEFLYIHIPFCANKCVYCDFLSIPYDESLARSYTYALCRELQMKKGLSDRLKAVFVGGGTPSVLTDVCLEELFTCIARNYSLADAVEITVEANPGTLTDMKVKSLKSQGVNRLSLGIQSFDNNELRTLGRIHDAAEAIRAAEIVRSSGIENISLDLMYGIPGQSLSTWKQSLDQAVLLLPQHISAYELTPEKKTPLKRYLETGQLTMPAEELIIEMSDLAIDLLASSGYEQYEISNYSLPGYRCRHNMNYWDRGDYLAVGAGAHSFIRGFRSRNTSGIAEYIERLSADGDPEIEKTEICCDDALKEFIFLGLRKTEGLRLSEAQELGLDLPEAGNELIQHGLVALSAGNFRLTRKGRHIANSAIVQLLQNLGL